MRSGFIGVISTPVRVDLFPPGWTFEQMRAYASDNLKLATAYTQSLPAGPVLNFCKIPLALARRAPGRRAANSDTPQMISRVDLRDVTEDENLLTEENLHQKVETFAVKRAMA
jgi:hypothetical protein